ncbi:hypothetical protein [Engelhardtia mirabilis]|uniref:Right handed beta helix domain-containing protein n=1 Tax=Engelhardtia mirabilis TaxID=2528011 RepID=A0A518BEC7_9BACT|nr:hypothetical protein Pla133_03950 [Planctomycetes bacterium Pla133]QDU99656.1 hypothetical protein Pla86_03950 [Planctomycetes bacterium Pla86]
MIYPRRHLALTLPSASIALLLSLWASIATASIATAQATWTVDDDGPADFSSVAQAVSSVAEGDVLLIAPGDYGSVAVDKSLTLLGDPKIVEHPRFEYLQVLGAGEIRLAQLDAVSLYLSGIPGRSQVENCTTSAGLEARDVGELFVRGCDFDSSLTFQPYAGTPGAFVWSTTGAPASRAQFVDCNLLGGRGTPFDLTSGSGGAGLSTQGADVVVARCRIRGGDGTNGPFGLGVGGAGVQTFGGSVEVRGAPSDWIVSGSNDWLQAQGQGNAVVAGGNGVVTLVSSISTAGPLVGEVDVVVPRPTLAWGGVGGPGSARSLELQGRAGNTALWFVSDQAAYDESFAPLFGLALILDPASSFASGLVQLAGQGQSVGPGFLLPATSALAGVVVSAQAAVVSTLDGSVAFTNGDDLLLGF